MIFDALIIAVQLVTLYFVLKPRVVTQVEKVEVPVVSTPAVASPLVVCFKCNHTVARFKTTIAGPICANCDKS